MWTIALGGRAWCGTELRGLEAIDFVAGEVGGRVLDGYCSVLMERKGKSQGKGGGTWGF